MGYSTFSSCITVHSVYILCLPVIYTCNPTAKEPLWTSSYPISSDKPIYEQISSQVKEISSQVKAQILSGTLTAGAKLPSIRALASDLGVSVITTKRAYADLEQLGFICTVQGKGCFVAEGNQELLRENQLCHIEELLAKAASQAEALGVTRDKLHEMLDLIAPETMQ